MVNLPSSTDAVVIGAGVMGASAAYYLASAGLQVVILERDTVGSGSTSKSAGGFRCQFSDSLNIRMAMENIRRFERFEQEFEIDIDFRRFGYLFLLHAEHVETFRQALELQNAHGAPSQMITPEQAQQIVPCLNMEGISAATFCPEDGFCTPEAVAQGYARAASNRGAQLFQGCEVTSINQQSGRVTGLTTDQGSISTDKIILTAGVWSGPLLEPLGINLPVKAVKRQVWVTRNRAEGFPAQIPLVIDFATGFYFHGESNGIMFGGKQDRLEDLAPIVSRRAPAILDLEITSSWWGYYAVTPDNNAVIGQAPGVEGLFYATGFSGHGFQQSPVVGEHLAQRVLGVTPTFDLSPFDMRRFATKQIQPEKAVV